MDQSNEFSYEKFLEYLFSILPTLPSLGKPRELIESHVESNPTPHVAAGRGEALFPPIHRTFGVRHNTVLLPIIEQSKPHWSQRFKTKTSEFERDTRELSPDEQLSMDLEDFRITKLGEK